MAARLADRDFDYIVVGGGSAGCAVAAGLAAQDGRQVALLEAGPRDTSPRIKLPAGFYSLMRPGRLNWNYTASHRPVENARTLEFPRGKVLGGCSAINGMVYIRGQRHDYDGWAEAGCSGWSYKDVLPLFRRSEDYWGGASEYHGVGGPIAVSRPNRTFAVADSFIEAAAASGIAPTPDFNGSDQAGAGYFDCTIRRGRRCSASQYLEPPPDNLSVLTGCTVDRILFDGDVATGVRLTEGSALHARREVILCAGAFNSPMLLERSGVGRGDLLRSLDIPVVIDLPGVGENLQDHANTYLSWAVSGTEVYADSMKPLGFARELFAYAKNRGGFLTNPAAIAGAFFHLEEDGGSRPDVQVHFVPAAVVPDAKGQLRQVPGINASVCLLQPITRGQVHIRSANPDESPHIDYDFLGVPTERRRQQLAVERLRDIVGQTPLAGYIDGEIGPLAGLEGSDLLRGVLETLESVHHFCGTCRMGKGEDAVVDERLRVRGTRGLRVADASIMPTIVSGNTHAASMMIGEKLCELIAEEARD